MKRFIGLAFFFSILIFLACDGEVTVNLYVQDLLELRSINTGFIYTTANVVISNITKDSEKDFFASVIGNVSNGHMVKEENSDAYSFDTKIPLIGKNNPVTAIAENDLLFIKMIETSDGFGIAYQFNEIVLDKIHSWVKSEYNQDFSAEDIAVNIIMNNDSVDDFSFTASSVYINGAAYPFEKNNVLKRRENLTIQVSEVLNMAVGTDSDMLPFIMFK